MRGYSGGTVTPTLAISQSAVPAALNITAEGTRDWIAPAGSMTSPYETTGVTTIHGKVLGEGLISTFKWVWQTAIWRLNSFAAAQPAITATDTDDIGVGLTADVSQVYIETAGVETGFGYCFQTHADNYVRTTRIYTAVYSGTITLTCRLSDGSLPDATTTLAAPGFHAAADTVFVVSCNASRPGQQLLYSVLVTNNLGQANVPFSAITVA